MKVPLPDLQNLSKIGKLQYLCKAASLIVDKYVFDDYSVNRLLDQILTHQEAQDATDDQLRTADGRYPCRFPGCQHSFKYDGASRRRHEMTHNPPLVVSESTAPNASQSSSQTTGESSETSEPTSADLHGKEKKGHDVFNYNCALLADGLFFLNFLDAISEGDGLRVMRQYKYMLLYCRADGQLSNKYALVCLYQSFYINSLFSPRDCERLVWNRSVNNKGGRGNNIAHDLEVEHSNLYNKGGIRNLGPNVTEKAVQALCKPPKANWKTSLFISLLDVSLLYQ